MAIFGTLKTARAQSEGRGGNYKVAFDYIVECSQPGSAAHTLLHSLAPGSSERVELGGGVFAMPQVYMTKAPREAGFFESHLAYVDVQAVISGAEIIEVTDTPGLKVKEDRTPGSDVLIYEMPGPATQLRLGAGDAAVLDPADAHMPCMAIAEPALVRKVVVKVPVA